MRRAPTRQSLRSGVLEPDLVNQALSERWKRERLDAELEEYVARRDNSRVR